MTRISRHLRSRRLTSRCLASRHEAGFSLIEVLCAILILGVGLVGLSEGITLALRSSKDSERGTQAIQLATSWMEELRAKGILTAGEEEGDCGKEFPQYGWNQKIESTPTDGLYEVTVTVEHAPTKDVLYELNTLLFEMPPSSWSASTETATGTGAKSGVDGGTGRYGPAGGPRGRGPRGAKGGMRP